MLHSQPVEVYSDYERLKTYLNTEFCITPRECWARFCTATRRGEESHIVFKSKLEKLWNEYVRSHDVKTFVRCVI